jgi:ParB-like chromosome segregation protein Spo0J
VDRDAVRAGAWPPSGVKAPTLPLPRGARARARDEAGNQRPWPADKVERWSIDRLIPYARNARTHTDAQVAAIAASIREWGWTTPALVGEDGGLIAGHARVLAARQLGIAEIPVMVAAGWTEAQKRAYVLADNQLAITGSGWDPELLRLELGELKLGGFDLSLTGFGDLELKDILADRTEGLTDPDDAPEAPEHPVAQTGDLWLLGRHRLLCGDSTVATDVERNGAIATTYSADEPERLRGPQHDAAWCDEIASWRYPEAWDMLMFGLRLGPNPRSPHTPPHRFGVVGLGARCAASLAIAMRGFDPRGGMAAVGRKSANTSPPSRRARARARDEAGNQRPWPADKVEGKIMGGNPAFRGTRVPVHLLAELVPSRVRARTCERR